LTPTNLPEELYRGTWRERLAIWRKSLTYALRIGFLTAFVGGPGQIVKWRLNRKRKAGETIWIDDLTFGKRDTSVHNPVAEEMADLTPNHHVPTRVSRAIKRDSYPSTNYPFSYRKPPRSGNLINGLNETEFRRPGTVFHTVDYTAPWGGLEFYFHIMDTLTTFNQSQQSKWDNRHADGPINPVQQTIDDPETMSEIVKAAVIERGAVAVGITEVKEHHLFEGAEVSYQYAISIAATMDREAMLTVPSREACNAVMEGYLDVGNIAIDIAQRIRAMGWGASSASTLYAGHVLHIPIAVDAGIGQLGKHGSLINKEYGSNIRLATVLTDLPLAIDEFADIGVDDFCASCQICVTNCPPHAIFDTKQMVRGEERWYVDFDRCVPYFSDNGGCGICIEVCPWSEAGRGIVMSEKMLSRREAFTQVSNTSS